jgi:hypothetical protein
MKKRETDLIGHASRKLCPMSSQLRLSPGTHRLFFGSCTHFAAFFRATATGFRTSSAMLVLMFLTFLCTGVTNCGANVAEFRTELRISTHKCRTGPTDICAVYAKPGALGHLTQALISTRFAFLSTAHAGFQTRLVLMGHWKILLC